MRARALQRRGLESPPSQGPVTEAGRPAEPQRAAPKYLPGREPPGGAEGAAIV